MIWRTSTHLYFCILVTLLLFGCGAHAATVTVDASNLVPHVEVSLSPSSGSFVEGSTFQIPILINTKGRSVNGIEIHIDFDANKLSIVQPSGGTSIIGVWISPPSYDNTAGTASYIGVVPDGIITDSGLIGQITFQAKSPGQAVVSVSSNSKILLNDGLGTPTIVDTGRAQYTILPQAPGGVSIFSDTHPFQDSWYNNNSPVLAWDRDPGVTGFSYVLDNIPSTIPDNMINSTTTTQSFTGLADGLWYFHIKAFKNGAWGSTGHFLIHIDTTPPADFKPEVNYLVGSVVTEQRTLLSFFTTDNLSGIDHYEVGVIDESQPTTVSPVFVQTESPFQVPLTSGGKLQVIVRAVDKAGNVRDASVNVQAPFFISKFINDYLVYILLFIILLGLVLLIIHYLVGHHIIRYFKRISALVKKEEIQEKTIELEHMKEQIEKETGATEHSSFTQNTQNMQSMENENINKPPYTP